VLLQETGTKSVFSVRELAYRQCDRYEILAAKVELQNHSDIEGGIMEGIMHVTVVFVTQGDEAVVLYGTDESVESVVYAKEGDLKHLIKPFK
jgi:hypothetical protein